MTQSTNAHLLTEFFALWYSLLTNGNIIIISSMLRVNKIIT